MYKLINAREHFNIGDRVKVMRTHKHPSLKKGDCGTVVGFNDTWWMSMTVHFDEGSVSLSGGWDADRFKKL